MGFFRIFTAYRVFPEFLYLNGALGVIAPKFDVIQSVILWLC